MFTMSYNATETLPTVLTVPLSAEHGTMIIAAYAMLLHKLITSN